jgi:TIR domain/GAF domain
LAGARAGKLLQMIITLRYRFKDSDERYFLSPSLDFLAGSSPACELVLGDALIEPRHARFFYLFGTWWVEPENRTALIRCRGRRIREATPLTPNVPVQLGPLQVRPEFTPRFQDADEPDGEIVGSTSGLEPSEMADDERLRILLAIRKALADQSGQKLFDALAIAMLDLFPAASASAILIHLDSELFPLASWPEGPSAVSFTLARRAAYSARGFLWERSLASLASQQLDSLKSVAAALYCPVVVGRRLYGVIAVNAEQSRRPLTEHDLSVAKELCRVTAGRFKEFAEGARPGTATTFISYSRADREEASRVAEFLRRDGVSVWMDERQRAGKDWRQQVEEAIRASDSMTVLLSPASLVSETVEWEVGVARSFGKPVLPVLVGGTAGLPDKWGKLHYFDLRGDSPQQRRALSAQLAAIADASRASRP